MRITDDMKPAEEEEITGEIITINELDPSQNTIDDTNIVEFMSEFDHTYMDRSRP